MNRTTYGLDIAKNGCGTAGRISPSRTAHTANELPDPSSNSASSDSSVSSTDGSAN